MLRHDEKVKLIEAVMALPAEVSPTDNSVRYAFQRVQYTALETFRVYGLKVFGWKRFTFEVLVLVFLVLLELALLCRTVSWLCSFCLNRCHVAFQTQAALDTEHWFRESNIGESVFLATATSGFVSPQEKSNHKPLSFCIHSDDEEEEAGSESEETSVKSRVLLHIEQSTDGGAEDTPSDSPREQSCSTTSGPSDRERVLDQELRVAQRQFEETTEENVSLRSQLEAALQNYKDLESRFLKELAESEASRQKESLIAQQKLIQSAEEHRRLRAELASSRKQPWYTMVSFAEYVILSFIIHKYSSFSRS